MRLCVRPAQQRQVLIAAYLRMLSCCASVIPGSGSSLALKRRILCVACAGMPLLCGAKAL